MIHRTIVTIAGRKRSVELEDLGEGRVRVVVDGRERRLDARQIEPGLWSLLDPATLRSVTADVGGASPRFEVGLRGLVLGAEVADARTARLADVVRRPADSGPTMVRAPMPGRVVKVLCRPGEHVKQGQGLLVVEAMKMENELRAPREATVRDIRCQEGAAVESGQDLVLLA